MKLHRGARLEDRDERALRIGDDGEATDRWNILGLLVDLASQLLGQRRRGIDVLDLNVSHPMRGRAHLGRRVWKPHHAAKRSLAPHPHDVVAAFAKRLRLPANDLGVEADRRLNVAWQVIVPNEMSVVRACHRSLLNCATHARPLSTPDTPSGYTHGQPMG